MFGLFIFSIVRGYTLGSFPQQFFWGSRRWEPPRWGHRCSIFNMGINAIKNSVKQRWREQQAAVGMQNERSQPCKLTESLACFNYWCGSHSRMRKLYQSVSIRHAWGIGEAIIGGGRQYVYKWKNTETWKIWKHGNIKVWNTKILVETYFRNM